MGLNKKLPSTLVAKLVPIVIKQLSNSTSITSDIESQILSLDNNIKCDDPIILKLKSDLESLTTILDNTRKLITSLQSINTVLNTISTIAQTLALVQLAIPEVIGVPSGPKTKIFVLMEKIGENCKSASTILSGILISINNMLDQVAPTIGIATNTLSSICSNERFVVHERVADVINNNANNNSSNTINSNGIGTNGIGTNGIGTNGNSDPTLYTSRFYNTFNVDDEDLQIYHTVVNDLLIESRNVFTDLIEAPSKLHINNITPLPSIGEIGDYYINSFTNEIYGPKLSDTNWGIGIKY